MRSNTPSPAPANACLYWRIADMIRLTLRCQTLPLVTDCMLAPCLRLCDGCLCGTPSLACIRLTPATLSGCCLNATLCLPILLHIETPKGIIAQSGEVTLPIECILRTPCCAPLHYFVQAEVCVHDICQDKGSLFVTLDVSAVIYAATLTPGAMPSSCTPNNTLCTPCCAPMCLPPLYPEIHC